MAKDKSEPRTERPTQLSQEASDALEHFAGKLLELLEAIAREKSAAKREAGQVGAEDVQAAFVRMRAAVMRPRTKARRMIASAIAENRKVAFIASAMMIILFCFGLTVFGYGVFGHADENARLAGVLGGSIMQLLLIMPLQLAVNARRHNFGIRILGFLLDHVEDPALLADLIRHLLEAILPKQSVKANGGP
jgi:hypothetical protein